MTAASLGYRMPAEWERHAATWLAWPHQKEDWPGKFEPIPWVYGEIIRQLTVGERVRLLVRHAADEKAARVLLGRVGANLERVEFFRLPTDRVWTRDYAPIFVSSDHQVDVAITDWKFNGWAKYPNHKLDDAVPARLAQLLGRPSFQPKVAGKRVVLEGGSIDVNGQGLLLTTEECLLSKQVQVRNPGLGKRDLERVLCDWLGVKKVLWLGEGIVGDDTHGHVDDLARFVDERTVVVASESDPRDDNYARLRDARDRLRKMTDLGGRKLEVVELPMPSPVTLDGQRLPASYANFYIANEAVLVPTFNDPRDRVALSVLAKLLPSRRIVPIHAVDLVWGLGTLHCMTQQEPA